MKYKKLRTALTVTLCFALVTFSLAQSEKYEPLLGIWDVETEDGQYSFTFEFSMEEGTLKGLFTGTSGEVEMENLVFEDNKLTFSVDAGGMVIDFSATIEGDKLEGGLSLQYGEANILGTKRK